MKFDCDKLWDRLRERREKLDAEYREWSRVFAWFPVRVAPNDCRWFEWVEVRRVPKYAFSDVTGIWAYYFNEYRACQ